MATDQSNGFKDAKPTSISTGSDDGFPDLNIHHAINSARTGSALAPKAKGSPQHHRNKPMNAAAAPTAATADPYGPPPLTVKPGATTSRSKPCRRSPLACIIVTVLVLLVVGVALGVGLGLGLRSSNSPSSSAEGTAGNTSMIVTTQPAQQQPGTIALAPPDAPAALPRTPPVGLPADLSIAPQAGAPTDAPTEPAVDTPIAVTLSPTDVFIFGCYDACASCALSQQSDDCSRCSSCSFRR